MTDTGPDTVTIAGAIVVLLAGVSLACFFVYLRVKEVKETKKAKR